MSRELLHFIDQIGMSKGLDREVVINALEEALSSAIKKRLGTSLEIYTTVDRDKGVFNVCAEKRVVETVSNPTEEITLDDALSIDQDASLENIVLVPQDISYLGRIAAQITKQVIIQKVREAERDMIHMGFKDRQGELITGRIQQRDRGDLIIDLGKVEAILPKSQQIPHESFRIGDHIRAYIMEVQRASRGPQIILSRTHPDFLRSLFELEVPEIHDDIVEIKNVVREPGERAKVAVFSRQRDVDAVGACVGVKGSRVQAIVRELRGEKIDVIEWSDEVAAYVKNALSPAVLEEIRINTAKNHILVIVPDEELSQAIGKKGQNVRLASRLIGWEIDIMSRSRAEEEEKSREEEKKRQKLADALDIPISVSSALIEAGYPTVKSLGKVTEKDLEKINLIGQKRAAHIMAKIEKTSSAKGGRS